MAFYAVGHRLPAWIAKRLFGDRARHGIVPDVNDPMWKEWLRRNIEFYNANQRASLGRTVNRAGHSIVKDIDLDGKRVIEIGPGALDHMDHWAGVPAHFTCVDIDEQFLQLSVERLKARGVPHDAILLKREDGVVLPVPSHSYDVILTFYSLEHIHPLEPQLQEFARILKPGGAVVGAIPCEGGFAWGLGRFLTSRRWLRKNTTIDPDKLICWEHPNFADRILNALSGNFDIVRTSFWPLRVPAIDVNLIARFVLRRRDP